MADDTDHRYWRERLADLGQRLVEEATTCQTVEPWAIADRYMIYLEAAREALDPQDAHRRTWHTWAEVVQESMAILARRRSRRGMMPEERHGETMTETTAVVRIPQGARPIACLTEKSGALGVLMAAPDFTHAALDEVITVISELALRFRGESSAELPRVWFREGAFVPAPEGEVT
jgi:hypothetical protein